MDNCNNVENSNKLKRKRKRKNRKINLDINFTVVGIVLIILLCVCITPVTFQNDTYYTIKIGEHIKNYGIDMMDPFSWHEDLSYTYPHWLYDLCTYLVYGIAGFKGIYIATCALSAVLGISIFLVNSKLTKNKVISFVVTIGSLYMLQDYIAARAQLVTFILFIWELFCIEKFIKDRKIIYGLVLIVISLLIANLHCATWPFFFVLFLPYIAEYIIAIVADTIIYSKVQIFVLKMIIKIKSKLKKSKKPERLERLKFKLEELENTVSKVRIIREEEKANPYKIIISRDKNVKFLIIIMIICALMGLITPIGDTPYTYLYKTMEGNTTKNISEHLPLTLANNTEIMGMLVIFLSILIFTKTKIKLSDLFMISGLCFLMFSTRRQLSMFALIGSVTLTRLVIDLISRYTKKGLEEAEKVFRHIGVVIALTVLITLWSYDAIKPKLDDNFVNSSSYPVEACDYILENIDLDNARFYNEYNFGSYMLFRGVPVFIDSRADLYAPEFSGNDSEDVFTDFINTSSISKFYEDTFKKYNITHLIISKNSKTNMIITKTEDSNYKELYSDKNFIVYERLNVENKD